MYSTSFILGLNVSKVSENALKEAIKRLQMPIHRKNRGKGGIGTVGSKKWSLWRGLNSRLPPYQDSPSKLLDKFQSFCNIDLQLADRTVKDHRSRMKRLLTSLNKDVYLVSTKDIRGYLTKFKSEHAPATYAGMLKSMRVFFRDFLDRPEIVSTFRFPAIPFKPKVVPSKDDLQKFYRALDSELSEAIFLFYASSGLRKTEILSLSLKNIDFDKRMVTPNCHQGSTKNSYVSFYNREAEEALSKIDKNEERLFQISDRQYQKIWKTAKTKTGLNITAQRLREWFCCEMAILGVNDRYIDALCGRTPKTVLARHYSDFSPWRLKRIYDQAGLRVLS